MPCPYLPGRVERRVITELASRNAPELHDALSRAGFRRSHSIAYAPACPDCNACQAVRVVAGEFIPSRSHRRVQKVNSEITVQLIPAAATAEQFELFSIYQKSRHGSGDMSKMDFFDYQALVEDSPVDTALVEFRDAGGRLIAVCLADILGDGLSAVYSFFATDLPERSLGTLMVLWLIEKARKMGLPYVYLGYWIADCGKMSYKVRFRPIEVRMADGWQLLETDLTLVLKPTDIGEAVAKGVKPDLVRSRIP